MSARVGSYPTEFGYYTNRHEAGNEIGVQALKRPSRNIIALLPARQRKRAAPKNDPFP